MELRKKNAFLGYTWRRMKPRRRGSLDLGELIVAKNAAADTAAVRALHRGRLSLK